MIKINNFAFYYFLCYNILPEKGVISVNIKELSYNEFQEFAQEHFIGNYRQSINYALLKAEEGYEYEFVGYYDIEGLKAASLILYKNPVAGVSSKKML